MPRPTLATISVYGPEGGLKALLRVISDHDEENKFTVIKVRPEDLPKAQQDLAGYDWIGVTDHNGMTKEQVGEFINEQTVFAFGMGEEGEVTLAPEA